MIIPIIFCLLLIIPNTSQDNCEDIVAYRSRDCVLSETDKRTYNYCCYIKYNYNVATCKPYTTEEEIQKEKEKLKSTESDIKSFVCNDKSVTALPEVEWDGCEDIEPSQASDCVMSQEDKNNGYELCCYEKIGSLKVCTLDTKESYQVELELINELGLTDSTTYECTDKVGEAGNLKYSIIFLLFIILYM